MKKIRRIIIGIVSLILVLTAGQVIAENLPTQKLSRAVIKIDSLSCGGCFSTINAGLSSLEGFSGMGANLFRKLIAIDFIAPLTPDKLTQKLSEIGYPGNLEYVDAILEKESFAYLESKRTGLGSGGGGCCSSGGSPGSTNQEATGQLKQSGGSCCKLPGISQPTEIF
ncbi:MAG: heavy-metal-associated domain-containing protein [Proteobacteria bacterium]|nr:heavy-metal-associated domain-containing protein [Pseudomonadota bacterium]MBU1581745.1 heavy-metal-associated domain-containing protein [Pseudomonadota bacterium]MBU2452373.1 heavy-metal-associated domain-containing protein [Pseudomonadota bacterium]MBU2630763.1 heavy-metal-associated domain-containing protein [Pseudomonadota bacterium]